VDDGGDDQGVCKGFEEEWGGGGLGDKSEFLVFWRR